MIDITGVDLTKFAQKVYELSAPQGLGFLHFTEKSLDENETKAILKTYAGSESLALSMDYVYGRACKMTVFKKEGRLVIPDSWYDHTDQQFDELLKTFNIEPPKVKDHGLACNCQTCRSKKGKK